ncbi:uncharacterized protein LOC124940748 isoform X2 [Impatiens glandulifera]|uniref:uncharacterized protein LOC124940748 isoform X2 n=1 Tax=Impatiens glandulifera TaxID=253017 RepID=UPI001FB0BEC5|nr:uncharacterized protein LOC124940748 isoform X2 [Impatiens glandulifera]
MKNNHLQLTKKKKEDRQTNFRSKSQKQISKHCLDYVPELDDDTSQLNNNNFDESSFSEIIHDSHFESANDFMENPILSAYESGKLEYSSISSSSNLDNVKSKFVEVDMMVSNLRQAEIQVLNSTNVDDVFKRIIYTLVEMVIEELNTMSGDKDRLPEIVSRKTHIVLLSSLATCICLAFMILLLCNGGSGSFIQPPPPPT